MTEAYSRKKALTHKNAEKKLAEALSMLSSFGVTFRKQAPKGATTIDFVSNEAKLVIELDVDREEDERQARYNATRREVFEGRGFRFLRFRSDDVTRDVAKVTATVMAALREQAGRAEEAKAAAKAEADASADAALPSSRHRKAGGA